jgi:hypothetical protein
VIGLFGKIGGWLGLVGERVETYRAEEVMAALGRMRAYLNGGANPIVRVYADAGGGFGQQAAAVRLLDRLFAAADAPVPGMAYTGANKTVQLVYDDTSIDTVENLRQLMQWPSKQWAGLYKGGQVDLVPFSTRHLDPANVCLSAACDRSGDGLGANMAKALKVSWFLRLQPFMYSKPDELQTAAPPSTTDLITIPQLGGPSFHERALRIDVPVDFDWSPYVNSDDPDIRRRSRVMQWLIGEQRNRGDFELLVTYGIHTATSSEGKSGASAIGMDRYDQVTQLVAGALATQRDARGPDRRARPIAIVNLGDFYVDPGTSATETQRFIPVSAVLSGGPSVEEQRTLFNDRNRPPEATERAMLAVLAARQAYFKQVNAGARAKFISKPAREDGDGYEGVIGAVQSWLLVTTDEVPSREKVLWVQLGRLPSPPFDYAIASSTLPSLFEGSNTTNLAVNLGRMYYRVGRVPSTDVTYPTVMLDPRPGEVYLRKLQAAANVVRDKLSAWPADQDFDAVPPETFAEPIRYYRTEGDNGVYHTYFRGIQQYYTNAANDKINLGLTYLAQLAAPARQLVLTPVAGAEVLADGAPLDELWTKLGGALSDGVLTLAPDGPLPADWKLTKLLTALFNGEMLRLTGATLAREPAVGDQITEVTATGQADWWGEKSEARLRFTAPDGAVQTELAWTWKARGSFPGLDWLVMENPTLTVVVSQGETLTYGGFALRVKVVDLGVELQWRFPTPANAWLVTASFDEEDRPSVGKFFALAGGIDLASLPAPFNVLGDLGLASLSVAYDPSAAKVGALGFSIRSSSPVHLIGKIYLHGISIETTIEDPTGTRAVSNAFAASFDIGKPEAQHAVIEVGAAYPGLRFSGALAQGPLGLIDLASAFLDEDMVKTLPIPFDPQPKLSLFSFEYDKQAERTSFSVAIDTKIAPAIGSLTPLQIDSVGLTATKVRESLAASIYGSLKLLPKSSSPLQLMVTSSYTSAGGWSFSAVQTGDPVDLAALAKEYLGWQIDSKLGIDGLSLTISAKDGSWLFTGKTAQPWHIDFLGMDVGASLRLGYNGKQSLAAAHPDVRGSTVALALAQDAALAKDGKSPYFGRVEAEVHWQKLNLTAYYDYAEGSKSFGVRWGVLQGDVKQTTKPEEKGDWVAELRFTNDVTIGYLIEEMVSWITGARFGLEAPWNVLNNIKLSGLALVYTFNTSDSSRNHVSFKVDIGPIELGFARIDGIEVRYRGDAPQGEPRVAVSISGSFPWNVGDGAVGDTGALGPWDASSPGSAPSPPGQGGKYVDLRFLALGQHVTPPELTKATTIKAAIETIRQLPPTDPGKLPGIAFDPTSAWLVGIDLAVLRQDAKKGDGGQGGNGGGGSTRLLGARGQGGGGSTDLLSARGQNGRDGKGGESSTYLVSAQAVFNDPHLYGLRVALDGEAAKVLKGLEFEILYRQLTDVLGVYQAEITLPDAMRKFDVGAYSLTLPIIAFAYYTNGDFLIDIGFPHNRDFSRSFRVEGIIYPGIPMVGAGGFYFGKLPEAATSQVPSNPARGTFNPIVVFGFGIQLGFGKSVEYGVLKAGFSLTVFGIVEGVLAKWNPYQPQLPESTGERGQLQGSYYFWLQGTVGILGKLYGSVDFAIIKAQVDVEISLYVQLTYESFVSITLTVVASVRVSVSVKIDLWLFSITLNFSFSLNLKETFAIHNAGTAPWAIEGPAHTGVLAGPADRRLTSVRQARAALAVGAPTAVRLDFDRLAAADPSMKPLTGYLMVALSIAADERSPADQSRQLPCYVSMLALDSVAPAALDRETSAAKAAGRVADSSFELLCKRVLAWIVAAATPGLKPDEELTYDQVLGRPVTDEMLANLLGSVLVSTDANPTPIPPGAIEKFLERQFTLTVTLAPQGGPAKNATSFPMPPALRVSLPAYGSAYPGYDYTFGAYNSLGEETLRRLRADFDALLVQVQSETGSDPSLRTATDGAQLSVGGWVFADFFLLIARQMVQAVRTGLRTFRYPLAEGAQVSDVIAWVEHNGGPGLTVADVIAANPTHPLAGGALTIGVTQTIGMHDSFATLAEAVARATGSGAIGAAELAVTNAAGAVLRTGTTITYPGSKQMPYVVESGDSLVKIAKYFDVRLGDLLTNAVATPPQPDRKSASQPGPLDAPQPGLLDALRLLDPNGSALVPLLTRQALPTDTFASIAGDDGTQLATANAGRPVLRVGVEVAYSAESHTITPRECLADVATALGVPLADLLAHATVDGTPLLKASGMLAALVVLALPPLQVRVAKGQTFQGLAAQYNTTTAVFGLQPANGAIEFDDTSDPYLDVAHLGELNLGPLLEEAQRTQALQHLSGIASRYQLHGLRLTTEGIQPNAEGMWVRKDDHGELRLPPVAGLHALTGQQFPLPVVQGTDTWQMTFDSSGTGGWLQFASDGHTTTKLTIPLTGGSPAASAIAKLTAWAHANRLDPWSGATVEQKLLGPAAMYSSKPAEYPFTAARPWQAVAPVTLPYGSGPSDPAVLRVWSLPNGLAGLPDPSRHALDPRVSLGVVRYDEASGATTRSPVAAYAWGAAIEFTVTRVPEIAGAPASASTYEIVGAGGENLLLLERLLEQQGAAHIDPSAPLVFFSFAPDATAGAAQGLQTDDPATVTAGIAQVDLSTDTRPPAMALDLAAGARAEAAPGQLLNKPADLLRLLWDASITRGGGFYLYYYDTASGRGLPDRVFNDRGQAVVTLLVFFDKPAAGDEQNRVANYMNVLATGEHIEAANSVLSAQADPTRTTVPTSAHVSLAGLAEAYFADVGDLADDNATLALRTGARVRVSAGVYQAPIGGIAIADAASRFGTTVAALQAANPPGDLPATLSFPLAIRLPSLTLTVGTSPSSGTLAQIQGYYGEDVTAVGADNAEVEGLFADLQQIQIAGGPRVRAATVPAGAAAFSAKRPVPTPIPTDPNDPTFPPKFLAASYTLLGYAIAGNRSFAASPLGIPAGPTVPADDPQDGDKMRNVSVAADGTETWSYTLSVPYSSSAKPVPVPPATASPYAGIGDVLQLDFEWLDHFGNRLVTALSDPRVGDSSPLNQPPLLAGYTDQLIALGQWPAVASSWQVLATNELGPAIEVELTFDATQYAGVLEGRASTATTIEVTFTEEVQKASAEQTGNYGLTDTTTGETIAVMAAAQSDPATVTLTVGELTEGDRFTLTVTRVLPVDQSPPGRVFAGTATFTQPDEPLERSSTVQSAAARDLRTYRRLREQLEDRGVVVAVSSSLRAVAGEPVPEPLSDAQMKALRGWIDAIANFLAKRAAFAAKAPVPASSLAIDLAIDPASINQAQIFQLSLQLTIARSAGVAAGDLATEPGIVSAVTPIAPLLAPASSDDEAGSLRAFAQSLQDTLSVSGRQLLKVATGIDRGSVGVGQTGASLWCVRVGLADGEAISYTLKQSPTSPAIFAPRPAANTLQSRPHIPIYGYTTDKGLSPTPTEWLDFANVDMDVWCRTTFAAIDAVLSPRYTAPMQIVGQLPVPGIGKQDWLGDLLSYKEKLAKSTRNWMVPVFADQADPTKPTYADPTGARAAFLQGLLRALSNAYATRAAIGLQTKVTADVREPLAVLPPNLFGQVGPAGPSFMSAMVDTNQPTAVLLRFSDPLDRASAERPTNYAVSDATVSAASLSSQDARLVTLTIAPGAVPAVTEVTVGAGVVTADGQALREPRTRIVVSAGMPDATASLTFSSPKLALHTGAQPLTFLITGPEVVHDATGEVLKDVELDLSWSPSAIEHQIGAPLDDSEYRPSSWLSFVIADDIAVLQTEVDKLDVPLPLRAFPASPTLTVQTAKQDPGPVLTERASDVGALTRWDYTVTYTLPYHYPQDELHVRVEFNVKDTLMFADGPEDAFAQVAQFVSVFPAVATDLARSLATIDATTTDPAVFLTAAFALQAFRTMVGWIADAAGPHGLTAKARPRRVTGEEKLAYAFTIVEGSGQVEDVGDALIVTLTGAPPDGIGAPSVLIEGYDTQLLPGSGEGTYRFAFRRDGPPPTYLVAAAGQAIPGRSIVLPGMDVLDRQDAHTSASIERNRFLAGNRESADAFIYGTGDVTFPNPLHPYVDRSDAVDIATIGSTTPVTRSLDDHLHALFAALLFDGVVPKADSLTFQVEATYAYPINPTLSADPVPLPVFMQPPLTVALEPEPSDGLSGNGHIDGDDQPTTLEQMRATWTQRLTEWFEETVPLESGSIALDLTIMTNLTATPMPLLHLRGLYLPVQYIDPPLKTRANPWA